MSSTPEVVSDMGIYCGGKNPFLNGIFPEALNTNEGMSELIAQLAALGGADGEEDGDSATGNGPNGQLNEELVEEELDMFEKILTQLLTVQSSTSSWSRNERLAYLNDMATTLDNIVEQED